MPERRFPPPWTVEEYSGITHIVRDANILPWLTSTSSRSRVDVAAANLMTKEEARKVAAGIAKLPELLKGPRD